LLPLLTNAGGRAQASRCHVRRDEPAPSSSFAVAELEYTAAAIVAVSSQNRRVEPGAAHPSVSCASLLRCSAQVRRASHPLLLSSVTASAATATADAARLCAALAHCRRRAWLRHCDSAERAGQPPSVCSYQLAYECKARTKIRSKWCAQIARGGGGIGRTIHQTTTVSDSCTSSPQVFKSGMRCIAPTPKQSV